MVLATSTTCHLCGHAGAGEVDLLVPLSRGGDYLDPSNLAPCHGTSSRCPVCRRACNQSKGDGTARPRMPTSRAW